MSGIVGRINAALATLHNENSLSLANLNLDFTLIKLEAPKEFHGLGATISHKRKANAEDGALHKTARKLGLLFDKALPKTPLLIKAYGTRVSEIAKLPNVNPQASVVRDGIFEGEVGADAASIWAAVTSGAGAVAVHLLACMLARIFTDIEATSVWVEFVETRRLRILEEERDDVYRGGGDLGIAMVAAQQEFSRAELANWDASARAWLQSADQAMAVKHQRLRLVLEESDVPVGNSEGGAFGGVMSAWTTALVAMERLLQGLPQQIQDGAALIGMSSWHLYPDMVVLGKISEDISQKDPLFEETAILTIGLKSERGGALSWSLPLARLQHYGRPVYTSRSAGQDNSRINAEQFTYVVLGCVFSSWGVFGSDLGTGLLWLEKLIAIVPRDSKSLRRSALHYLHQIAQNLAELQGTEGRLGRQLYALGRRNPRFLGQKDLFPFFGLAYISNFLSFLKTDDSRVALLRNVSSRLGLRRADNLISCRKEFATVLPMSTATMQNRVTFSSGNTATPKHGRWQIFSIEKIESFARELAIGQEHFFGQTHAFLERCKQIESYGEFCLPCLEVRESRRADAEYMYVFGRGNDWATAVADLAVVANHYRHGRPRYQVTISFPVVSPTYIVGCPGKGVICSISDTPASKINELLQPEEIADMMVPSLINSQVLAAYTKTTARALPIGQALEACISISTVYKLLPNATISTLVFGQSLLGAKWIPDRKGTYEFSRAQTFACIAMLDSGTSNLDPEALSRVFAMSTGNSIYVAGALLCDPHQNPSSAEVQRVVGNIGRAGISFLLAPPEPNVREPKLESWRQINHLPFEGTCEDCFQHTSIHLSFTTYEMPLSTGGERHLVDQPVKLLETLVAAHDRGAWVADLDLLDALDRDPVPGAVKIQRLICSHMESENPYEESCKLRPRMTFAAARENWPALQLTCVDNWEELLEMPESGHIIVRASGNRLARLALTGACVKLGFGVVVLPEEVCWACCAKTLKGNDERWGRRKRTAFIC